MKKAFKAYYETEDFSSRLMRQRFPRALVDFLKKFGQKSDTILDIGCGDGRLTRLVAGNDSSFIVGIDFSEQLAEQAKKRGIDMQVAAANSLCFRDLAFERVLAISLIEHLLGPEDFLREVRRVLKPGGKLAVVTPNLLHILNRTYFFLGKMPLKDEALADRGHLRFFSYGSLEDLMRRCGYECVMHPFPSDNALYSFLHRVSRTLFSREIVCLASKIPLTVRQARNRTVNATPPR